MKLIVVIPAYNEEATVKDVVQKIPKVIEGVDSIQTIVVDDGSTDNTAQKVLETQAILVRHASNRGLALAIKTGIDRALKAKADIIVTMDADGQFDPGDIPKLIEPIIKQKAEFVTATRFAKKEYIPKMPIAKYMGNKLICKIINYICWRSHFTDVSCGFRAYSRDTALKLHILGRFTYTHEMFIDLVSKNIEISEVPVKVLPKRKYGKSYISGNLFRYGINALEIILRASRDIRPLAFFGSMGLISFIFGFLQGLFVFIWWCIHHRTYPYKSLLIGSSLFISLGVLLFIFALLADMIGRVKKTQEELLFLERHRYYEEL